MSPVTVDRSHTRWYKRNKRFAKVQREALKVIPVLYFTERISFSDLIKSKILDQIHRTLKKL